MEEAKSIVLPAYRGEHMSREVEPARCLRAEMESARRSINSPRNLPRTSNVQNAYSKKGWRACFRSVPLVLRKHAPDVTQQISEDQSPTVRDRASESERSCERASGF
jgi:hypothetical protein